MSIKIFIKFKGRIAGTSDFYFHDSTISFLLYSGAATPCSQIIEGAGENGKQHVQAVAHKD